MKKRTMLVLLVFVLVVATMCFVACNKENTDTNEQEPQVTPGEYEVATYTVTFNTMGGTKDPNWTTRTYEYGARIDKPTYVPIKSGYTFKYWASTTSGTKFDFDTSSVQNDFTLYAIYETATITHTYDLTAVLHDTVDGYVVVKDEYTKGYMASEDTVLATQYGNSSSVLAIAYTTNPGDRFLFWYYLDDNDQPVKFSTTATTESQSVTVLTGYKGSSLELYPMWLSTAAKVTVTFKDATGTTIYPFTIEEQVVDSWVGTYGDTISIKPSFAKADSEVKSLTYYDKDGYKQTFYFDLEGSEDDATSLEEMVDYDFFANKSVTVDVNWVKKISIATKANFETYYNLLRTPMPSDADAKAELERQIEELLTAKIGLSSINFGGAVYEPLFDSDHVFTGIIDSAEVDANAIISNVTFKGNSSISVFGYVNGEIKNIDVKSCSFEVGDEPANSILLGGIATVLNGGKINNCNVQMDLAISGVKDISIGGIVVEGSGEIQNCSVTINSCSIDGQNVTFGGIAAKVKATSTCLENKATITIDSISASTSLIVGGIAASNAGTVSNCESNISVKEMESFGVVFGGLVANNGAVITKSISTVDLGVSKSVVIKGAAGFQSSVGGLLGTNSGQLTNSYSNVKIAVSAPNANISLFVGGMVGLNSSLSSTSTAGAINYGYATGTIDVSVPDGINNTIYVGGLVGKNTQNGISSVFSEVKVSITQKDGTTKAGYLIGYNTATSTLALTFVSSAILSDDANKLTINGTKYTLEDNTIITKLTNEAGIDKANLRNGDVIFGTGTQNLKFDNTVWVVKEDGSSLPKLAWEK